MGTFYTSKKNYKKINEKKPKLDKKKIKPFFKEKIILSTEYNYGEFRFFDCFFSEPAKLSIYDIYKLNKINDSFYLAFLNNKIIKILKYDFINKTTTEKAIINHFPKKIKYFFDQIQNKEYLFVLGQKKGLRLFLIKNDIEYEEEKIYINTRLGSNREFHDFDIIYDKYNKINCLILSYTFYFEQRRGRKIYIFKFSNNEITQIKMYKANDCALFNNKRQKLLLSWENKLSKRFYLITSDYLKLKFMEISGNIHEYISDFEIVQSEHFNKYNFHFFGCILYNKNNTDYLYICNDIDVLKIIDLYKKQIIREIEIMKNITSIIKLNNKYIIISSTKSIYTFDTNTNQLINKNLINPNGEIISIKAINIDKLYQFYLSFDTTDGKIVIM